MASRYKREGLESGGNRGQRWPSTRPARGSLELWRVPLALKATPRCTPIAAGPLLSSTSANSSPSRPDQVAAQPPAKSRASITAVSEISSTRKDSSQSSTSPFLPVSPPSSPLRQPLHRSQRPLRLRPRAVAPPRPTNLCSQASKDPASPFPLYPKGRQDVAGKALSGCDARAFPQP